jgi:hypothetical protein
MKKIYKKTFTCERQMNAYTNKVKQNPNIKAWYTFFHAKEGWTLIYNY